MGILLHSLWHDDGIALERSSRDNGRIYVVAAWHGTLAIGWNQFFESEHGDTIQRIYQQRIERTANPRNYIDWLTDDLNEARWWIHIHHNYRKLTFQEGEISKVVTLDYGAVFLPLWLIVATVMLIPCYALSIWIRRKNQKLVGRCTNCGYDIRESKERCPECGTRITGRLDGSNIQKTSRILVKNRHRFEVLDHSRFRCPEYWTCPGPVPFSVPRQERRPKHRKSLLQQISDIVGKLN